MANILHELIVDEVSLVDHPSNAEVDPRTGKKIERARVAFFKRDNNRKEKKMKFKKILKSAATRDQIVAAVEAKAQKIAKRLGVREDIALAAVWRENPEAQLAYENAPKPVARKAAPPLVQVTQAEIELDSRARQVMKRDGIQYPQACAKALDENPEIYVRYCNERAAGHTFTAPDPAKLDVPLDYVIKRGAQAQEDGVCHACDEPVDDDDEYCSQCGADLAAQRATKAKRAPTKRKDDPGTLR